MTEFLDQLEEIEAKLSPDTTSVDVSSEQTPEVEDDVKYVDEPIADYPTSYNIVNTYDRPDLRNIKYVSATDHLQCPICQQPFINPMTTLCGHTFCKDCIMECFKMSRESDSDSVGLCPLDRTPIDSSTTNDLFPTPILINNLVDDLKVYCLNWERGCEWTGCRWEAEHHVVSECDYTGVRCNGERSNGKTCGILVERRHVTEKEEDADTATEPETRQCVHRVYECNFCQQNITKTTEDKHLQEECDANFHTCEICSNDMIPMKSLAKHQANCTKATKFICPAKSIGCDFIGNNEPSLENHTKNNCQLSKLLPYLEGMNDKMDSLTKENRFLQSQINKILNSIVQGKVTNLGYNEPIEEINKFKNYDEADQDKLVFLNYEIERLKCQIDEKLIPFIDKQTNEREPVINNLVNDSFMMKDDLNLQRMLINSLRKQIQFILFKNHRPSFNGINNPIFDEELSDSEERMNLKL